MNMSAFQNFSQDFFVARAPLAFLAVALLVCMTGAAAADDIRIVDLASQTDSENDTANIAVLNASSNESDFSFSGGVGAGPDLSGNGNMVQIVQPITANNAAAASNGQISYRYIAAPSTGGSH